jgi:hypothetical protein
VSAFFTVKKARHLNLLIVFRSPVDAFPLGRVSRYH